MDNELLKIGAAYVRVSDERQDEYSPTSQIKKIREYAAKEGYIIPDEYVFYDDGISGKSTQKREEFNRMISMAKDKSHPFDRIYVWKFSRFARNQEQSIAFKNLLQKKSVAVVSVSEPIPEGHYGTLIERVIEWMDEFYLVNLGTEVLRGMNEKVARGEPVVPAPFGYINAEKTYLVDEETAPIVREIFQRYADGEGQRAIAKDLSERGIRTKRGNPIENRWVEYVLWNPAYIGKIRWTPDGSKAVSKRDYTNESIQISDGNWQPIISMELWDTVQKLLAEQKIKYAKYARKQQPISYMLKGLVRCSSCGGTLAASGTSGKAKTRCLNCCNYAKGACLTSHCITIPKAEAAIISCLKQALKEKKFTISPKAPKASSQQLIDYDKLIAVEERRLARAKEAFLAEVDTLEQYSQNKKDITEKIEKLKERRDNECVKEIDTDMFVKKVMGVLEFIERDDITAEAKNEALRTIIEKVVYEKAKSNLAIYFHDI